MNHLQLAKGAVIMTAAALFLYFPASIHAFEFRTGDAVTVGTEEKISGSMFVSGKKVVVDGDIDGDLYCAGQEVEVSGVVTGDILCAAQTLRILGSVDGSVRAAGQTIDMNTDVGRNITTAGQTVNISEESIIAGEVFAAGSTLTLNGDVGDSAILYGETVMVNGSIANNLRAGAGSLTIGDMAMVGGTLTYQGSNDPVIAGSAQLAKPIVREEMPEEQSWKDHRKEKTPADRAGSALFGLVGSLVVGVVLIKLFERMISTAAQAGRVSVWTSIFYGFAFLFLGPIALILLMITIIGIPLAFIGFVGWLVVLAVSGVVTAYSVGSVVMMRFGKERRTPLLTMVSGVAVLWILSVIPVVGWITSFASLLYGSGAILRSLFWKPTVAVKKSSKR